MNYVQSHINVSNVTASKEGLVTYVKSLSWHFIVMAEEKCKYLLSGRD
jgi:hypothetical protein